MRILVAGVGNVFRGDDAFGVEVVRRLLARPRPEGVRVADFGLRGHDLAYVVLDGYDLLILVDAIRRDSAPGTLSTLELDPNAVMRVEATGGHGFDLPAAFRLVRDLGGVFPRVYLIGCEPAELGPEDEGLMELTAPVQKAVEHAVRVVESLLADAGGR